MGYLTGVARAVLICLHHTPLHPSFSSLIFPHYPTTIPSPFSPFPSLHPCEPSHPLRAIPPPASHPPTSHPPRAIPPASRLTCRPLTTAGGQAVRSEAHVPTSLFGRARVRITGAARRRRRGRSATAPVGSTTPTGHGTARPTAGGARGRAGGRQRGSSRSWSVRRPVEDCNMTCRDSPDVPSG